MKKRLIKIVVSAVSLVLAVLVPPQILWLKLALFAVSYIVVGAEVILKAVRNILQGQVFEESFLMTIATGGALIVGAYAEGIAVMLFYQIGELFQSFAVNRSRKSIATLMDIRPDYANVVQETGIIKTDPYDVAIGDIILIRAGEKIPLDSIVLEGSSLIDTAALTGESIPREVSVGDEILSGCINVNGVLTARVVKEFGESTVSKILDLVENASSKKANTENFITKFARIYTPIVVGAALILAVIPPLVIPGALFSDWVYRALTFLVVSCPCALVVSVPMTFFGGLGGASRSGILVKGSNYLEALARVETVVFDKTGTLTKGIFEVQEIHAIGMTENALLEYAAYAEHHSNHPLSLSLKEAYGLEIDATRIEKVEELSGHGMSVVLDGTCIKAGNARLMRRAGIESVDAAAPGTVVHVAVDGAYAGYILIADEVKEDSRALIEVLKAMGIKQTVMLTGDSSSVGLAVGAELGVDTTYSELLPGDKVEKLEELLAEESKRGTLAFVGDGINDAPVIARADIGIAMGAMGSDAAIEAADIVIMTDEPSKIASAIRIAKKTLRIASQNIWFALSVKFIVLILSALGIATMWEAVFADVGVTILAVLNAFRALRTRGL